MLLHTEGRKIGLPLGLNSLNGCVGCRPPASLALQKREASGRGLAVLKQNDLLALEVVFGPVVGDDDDVSYLPGDTVWVEHADVTLEYLKRAFDVDGVAFVLVPVARIRLRRKA